MFTIIVTKLATRMVQLLQAALRSAVATRRLAWVLGGVVLQTASAQVLSFAATLPTPVSIPDNSAVGTVQSLNVDGITAVIKTLEVQLNIQSHGGGTMYNGDLYLTLVHNGTSAVLLNRVGRRDGFSAGYADAGFNVTLSDSAVADIHSYRVTLNGSDFAPLASGDTPGPLTGTWQPDGRTADPEAVLTTSQRIASLALFSGASANGNWSLFLADLSPGASADLVGWSINITPVPEPTGLAIAVGISLIVWGILRRRQV
jgi:subtilisin-like proprotein convertase family protein